MNSFDKAILYVDLHNKHLARPPLHMIVVLHPIDIATGIPTCWESQNVGELNKKEQELTFPCQRRRTPAHTSTTRTSTLNAAFKSIVATQRCVSNCAAPLHLVHSQQWTVQTGLKDFFAYRKSWPALQQGLGLGWIECFSSSSKHPKRLG